MFNIFQNCYYIDNVYSKINSKTRKALLRLFIVPSGSPLNKRRKTKIIKNLEQLS